MQSLSILNHDMEPYSLAALEALEYPASPRDIPADITLAELETIRAGWLAQARAQQIPDKLFEIAYWLGGPFETTYGDYRLWTNGSLRIWATLQRGLWNVKQNAWNTLRSVVVYLDETQQTRVLLWHWYYVTQSIQDEPQEKVEGSELLYVPGEWVASALAMQPKADLARIGIAQAHEASERDRLAKRLLVGMSV